jgi:hypothetical protein
MNKTLIMIMTMFCFSHLVASGASSFFKIESVKFFDEPPRAGCAIYKEGSDKGKKRGFMPFIEVIVQTAEQTLANTTYVRAYYYDFKGNKLDESLEPYPVVRGGEKVYPMPVFFSKTKETVYFVVPEKVLKSTDWRVLIVFGDERGATAKLFPANLKVSSFDFPERRLVENPDKIKRVPNVTLVEHVVKTHNSKQPQITLFMKPPSEQAGFSDSNGVLAICLLANSLDEIRRTLLGNELSHGIQEVLRFAEYHNLTVICWASRSLWDPKLSWDEQSKRINRQLDDTFDDVSKAWTKGIDELSKQYGIPKDGFLLWGISGSAQYAARLALRQPQYFLAVHIHIPSSFDKPTKEANRILWCLTTGENEYGYKASLRFLSACKSLGYPIIYKAVIGLGHAGHPDATRLGLVFFEYALNMQKVKQEHRSDKKKDINNKRGTDKARGFDAFGEPLFIADVVNQKVLSPEEAYAIPVAFQIALPTAELAEAWKEKE